jgi:hypothetical protein
MLYLPLLCLTSCGADDTASHDKVMDQIEHQVRFPSGYGPIAKYDRSYAADKSGHIKGVYLTAGEKGLPIGKRNWLDDFAALPSAFDGGCNVITVVFDTKAEKLVSEGCNESS